MSFDSGSVDSFAKLEQSLGELEIVIGPRARAAVAQVRESLREAARMRERGDLPGALESIRGAMTRLAALAAQLDQSEGDLMRAVAQRFTRALASGDKGDAKDAVNLIRRKAGSTDDENRNEW